MAQQTTWPALELEGCRDTLTTLHLYAQVIGKVQLALTPWQAGWANAPLRLTSARPRDPTPVARRAQPRDRIRPRRAPAALRAERRDATCAAARAASGRRLLRRGHGDARRARRRPHDRPDERRDGGAGLAVDRHRPRELRPWLRFRALPGLDPCRRRLRPLPLGLLRQADPGRSVVGHVRPLGRALLGASGQPAVRQRRDRARGDGRRAVARGFLAGRRHLAGTGLLLVHLPQARRHRAATVTPPGAQWSPEAGEFIVPYETIRRSADPAGALLGSASRPTAPAPGWPAGTARSSNATRRRTGSPESGDASMRGRPSLPGPAGRRPGRRTRGGGRCRR